MKQIQIIQKDHLEKEKQSFLIAMANFLDSINLQEKKVTGRPKSDLNQILKQLLIMSYNGMSYRRAISDIELLFKNGFLTEITPRSTLNNYANKQELLTLLEELIPLSALFFKEEEEVLIVDSTWFGEKMYTGGYKEVHGNKAGLTNTRKIHVAILQNSKAICFARPTIGTVHDCPMFKEIINEASALFNLNKCLGDKAYCSKDNYVLCQEKGILAYLDFKKHFKPQRAKSEMWKEQLRACQDKLWQWNHYYRFRVTIEGAFSVMKKKFNNYLRSRNENSRDVEMLLKCLSYNLCLIGQRI